MEKLKVWKWLKSLITKIFGIKFTRQLNAPQSNSDIEVRLIPHQYSNGQESFQNSITKIHKDEGLDEENLRKAVEEILTVHLPKEYKEAFRYCRKEILIGSFSCFKGNNRLLEKAFPILKEKLSQLGINNVRLYTTGVIVIDTDSITKAAEHWEKTNAFSIEVEVNQPTFVKLNKNGTYH